MKTIKIKKQNNNDKQNNDITNNEKQNNDVTNNEKQNNINSYLCYKGYAIYKSSITLKDQLLIRNDLTMKPYVQNALSQAITFPIYLESEKKLYVPRYWGINNFGPPKDVKIKDGENINLKFNGELRDYQNNVINAYLKEIGYHEPDGFKNGKGGALIEIGCGKGKTVMALKILSILGKKTGVIVHKTFLMNQWIERINQFLPGARVGTIQGQVIDVKDKDIVLIMLQSISQKEYPEELFHDFGFVCCDECFKGNTLIHTNKGKLKISELYNTWVSKKEKNDIEILSFNLTTKDFEYKSLTYAWKKESKEFIKFKLSKQVLECTPNHKILTPNGYIKATYLEIGDIILAKYDKNHINTLVCPALNNDQIQILYGSYLGDGSLQKTSKNRYRLKFIHCKNQYDYIFWKAQMFQVDKLRYIQKNGFSQKEAFSFSTKCFDLQMKINNNKEIPDWIIDHIDERGIAIWFMDDGTTNIRKSKNDIISYNVRIASNNFDFNNNLKLVKLFSRFNIICKIAISKKKYYELHFNKENSFKLFQLIRPYIHENFRYKINYLEDNKYIWNNKFLDYGTLIVTSKEYITEKNNINVYDIEVQDNHNFIIATKNPKNYIDGTIVSNCHHLSGEVFSKALQKLNTQYLLGLSATMNRKDGLTKLFKMYLGEICFKDTQTKEDNVLVKVIKYDIDDDEFEKEETDFRGNPAYSTMISKLSNYNNRSELILSILKTELFINPNQQFIILAHTKALLNYLYSGVNHQNISTVGYYVGGMKEADLKQSEGKQIILATYAMAAEALDIKSLTSLIFATPKTDIEQSVGRILRAKHNQPLIIDILDPHDVFKNQYSKRRKYYVKKNYKIIKSTSEKYLKYVDKYIKYKKENDISDPHEKYHKLWEVNHDPSEKKVKLKKNTINDPNYLTLNECLQEHEKIDINFNDDFKIESSKAKQNKCLITL